MQRPTIMVDFITLKGVLMLPNACIVMPDNDTNPSFPRVEIPLFLRNIIFLDLSRFYVLYIYIYETYLNIYLIELLK